MGIFITYYGKVLRRAFKDTGVSLDAILPALGLPKMGVIKITILVAVAFGITTYLFTGGLAWTPEKLESVGISVCTAVVLILLLFFYNLAMAPVRIDNESESATKAVSDNKKSLNSYEELQGLYQDGLALMGKPVIEDFMSWEGVMVPRGAYIIPDIPVFINASDNWAKRVIESLKKNVTAADIFSFQNVDIQRKSKGPQYEHMKRVETLGEIIQRSFKNLYVVA